MINKGAAALKMILGETEGKEETIKTSTLKQLGAFFQQ